MKNKYLEIPIEKLNLDSTITNKLKFQDILLVKDLWLLKGRNLKQLNFTDNEIKQIIIKLQLNGLDLNRKIY